MSDVQRKLACRYAVVQFMPYSETGEFANVGVVLFCPETGFFDYRLQARKYGRITAFFDELEPKVYLSAIRLIQGELIRLKGMLTSAGVRDHGRELFAGLIHPREAIIRFGPERVLLARQPNDELNRLFEHYVDRAFATPEYVEQVITKRLRTLIGGLNLEQPFRDEQIGDDEVHAHFPLVQRRGERFSKVIKPFNLSQDEPNSIFTHGDAWLQKLRRLRKKQLLPQQVLFAVAAPPVTDRKRYAAYAEICSELQALDVAAVAESANREIAEFAAG